MAITEAPSFHLHRVYYLTEYLGWINDRKGQVTADPQDRAASTIAVHFPFDSKAPFAPHQNATVQEVLKWVDVEATKLIDRHKVNNPHMVSISNMAAVAPAIVKRLDEILETGIDQFEGGLDLQPLRPNLKHVQQLRDHWKVSSMVLSRAESMIVD